MYTRHRWSSYANKSCFCCGTKGNEKTDWYENYGTVPRMFLCASCYLHFKRNQKTWQGKKEERKSHKECYACGSQQSPEWIYNRDEKAQILHCICHACKQAILIREARIKLHKAYDSRKIYFKTKTMVLEKNPRTGVCSWCRAVVPFDTPMTHMHHEKYHDGNPIKDAIELCISCHRKETIKRGNMHIVRNKKTGRIVKPIYNSTTDS